jgi:hypothetical protein
MPSYFETVAGPSRASCSARNSRKTWSMVFVGLDWLMLLLLICMLWRALAGPLDHLGILAFRRSFVEAGR